MSLEKNADFVVRGVAGGSDVSENLPGVSVSTAAKSHYENTQIHTLISEMFRGAFDNAKNHKRQSVTAKREKSQTPKFV